MAFKFLQIGKANAEIERLTTALAAMTKERDDAIAALDDNTKDVSAAAEEANTKLAAAQADLVTAKASIESLGKQVSDKDKEITGLKEKLANPSAQTNEIASRKAAEIVAAQGVPPVKGAPAAEMETKTMSRAQFAALSPAEQAKHARGGGKITD